MLTFFHWALKNGVAFDEVNAHYEACRNGQVEALKWLDDGDYGGHIGGGPFDEVCPCCYFAAVYGQLNILQWIVSSGNRFLCDGYTLNATISGGYLETVEFLLDNGSDMYGDAGYVAALFGYLDILKLLDYFDYEWTDSVIDYAAAGGHLEVYQICTRQWM
jgi:hypothetical protein